MLKPMQNEQYSRDGYLLIRNVLTAEQVSWLRAFVRPKFDSPMIPGDSRNTITSDILTLLAGRDRFMHPFSQVPEL